MWIKIDEVDREYPISVRRGRTSRAFCNSPVHEQWFTSQFWWGDVRQHWQPLYFTVPEINRIVLLSCISILLV
jgi:hypothetical protein